MSRGHGAVQNRVRQRLEEHAQEHPAMDDFAPGEHDNPASMRCPSFLAVCGLASSNSRSAIESARRAVKKLAAEGVVELQYLSRARWSEDRLTWVDAPHLCARLTLTPDAQDEYDTAMKPRQERADAENAAAMAMFTALTR